MCVLGGVAFREPLTDLSKVITGPTVKQRRTLDVEGRRGMHSQDRSKLPLPPKHPLDIVP